MSDPLYYEWGAGWYVPAQLAKSAVMAATSLIQADVARVSWPLPRQVIRTALGFGWERLHVGSAMHIGLESVLGMLVYRIALGCLEPQFIRIGWRQLMTPVAEER